MGAIDEAIIEHFKTCSKELPKKFVPWTWVVGICVILLAGMGGTTAFFGGGIKDAAHLAQTAIEKNRDQDRRLESLESIHLDIKKIREILEKR